jgi:p-aminobenzoyl-glutamate transporter AbgT
MVAKFLESIGKGLEKVVTPIHDKLDPENETGDSTAYYLGGTTVVLLVVLYLLKDKLIKPKVKIRYRKAKTAVRRMYSRKKK